MKRFGLVAAVLPLTASVAWPQGIDLSWNDCGTSGAQNQAFACETGGGGAFTMVASFSPPSGVDQYLGLSSQIDVFTDSAELSDWWKHGSSQCRGTNGLVVGFDFTTGPFACTDFFLGHAVGGFAYDVGFGGPERARLRVQCAVPIDLAGPVTAGVEYYAYKVNLARSNAAGAAACAGCGTSACIVLDEIQLFQPSDARICGYSAAELTWQPPASGPAGCPYATQTRSSTWGRVKSLYR